MFKRILIAVNSSPQADYALEAGIDLATQLSGELALVHVIPATTNYSATEFGVVPVVPAEGLLEAGEKLLARMKETVPEMIPCRVFLREGDAAHEVVEAAREWNADLIMTGTHGRGRLSQFLLGSTAESIIRHAACPVFTVRERVTANRDVREQVA